MQKTQLSVATRKESLQKMAAEELDILVIGGGVTGAGTALDAASRGLRVGIVEAQDWSSGTSSRSSKLVHGGLRYLYQLNFALVAESLRERGLLLTRTAPHLVKAQPFLWPLKMPVIERAYSAVGVGLYDAIAQFAHKGSVPIQRHHTKKGSLKLAPALSEKALIGSLVYYDARVDDARLVVNLLRTAAGYGALAANRAQVVELMKEGERVVGALVRDVEDGTEYKIRAKRVINSTGVWTEETQKLSGSTGGLKVLASKGIHIVVPKDKIDSSVGLFLRTEKSVLFIIPWKRYWIIGTTDTKYHEDLREPVANKEDIQYLLDHANSVLAKPLTVDDIIGTFAGLRPLLQPGTLDGDKTKSTKVSREHTVTEAAPGLCVIAGGKLTSYRKMAEDVVDFALGAERAKQLPCLTTNIPLSGATGYEEMWEDRRAIAGENQLSVEHVEDLLDRYGSDVSYLFELIDEEPTLRESLKEAPEYLRAEIAFGIKYEGALHLEDLVRRRTRLCYERRDRGLAAAEEIAEIAAGILGWSDEIKREELENYKRYCAAEKKAEEMQDEVEAQQEMLKADGITEFKIG
ncbi:glycerol-3-phosphate dehydrogenase/oxidase [Propionimicrobium lymphophilum]|uniref:glycerol-3-phosphate dehydrogenase/oxidase n=1 Tax=Propionimicrobium lymphophilum TaxID=33012 RepID=UPI00254D8BAC|nr:glycerol-3-phosphate dehydrogenase/oxidase [Propionimicrobium lymphophilum]MDK7709583.1 glycerol-3-phosphate dehydrogenase/oxidase [Propionimicrobium lymphophilum]MDK7733569.1 glycerol-3-phosphate dehydrogenase/oxidase [Propionimicrobium lymphophilum]